MDGAADHGANAESPQARLRRIEQRLLQDGILRPKAPIDIDSGEASRRALREATAPRARPLLDWLRNDPNAFERLQSALVPPRK